jgi:glycosyltransferase involved in cell wall biosynthesis
MTNDGPSEFVILTQPMRIVIASTYVPFRREGELTLVHNLAEALSERDYLVETVLLPFDSGLESIAEQTLAIRSLDLTESSGNKIDLLITLRTPAQAIPHPNKVVWFRDHPRDTCAPRGTPDGRVVEQQDAPRIPGLLTCSDACYLSEAKRIYARSKTAANRLKQLNGLDTQGVLYPPLHCPERFQNADFGDYFLYVSRLNPEKRQALAIQAMKYVKSPFKLVLAGQADPENYGAELQSLIRLLDLEDRVQLLGWVSLEQKAALLANACAALYLPADADSYGYVTLEAFHASKPVITLADSGGPTEIIEDSWNGLIVEPQAEALAAAMEKLWQAKMRTALMGRNAFETIRLHGISWDRVLEALVA